MPNKPIQEKKRFKIPQGFFKKLNIKIELPTFKCKICGKKILDCTRNWNYK